MNFDIDYVAKLANLPLTETERVLFIPQLSAIFTFIEKLDEIDTKEIEPTLQVTGKINEFRQDSQNGDSLKQTEATQNAKLADSGYILTKGVFDEST